MAGWEKEMLRQEQERLESGEYNYNMLSDTYELCFVVQVSTATNMSVFDETCNMQRMLDILCTCGYDYEAGKVVAEALQHHVRMDWHYGDQTISEWEISHDDNPHNVFISIYRYKEI